MNIVINQNDFFIDNIFFEIKKQLGVILGFNYKERVKCMKVFGGIFYNSFKL